MKQEKYKLTIDLVPSGSWGKSLCKLISKEEWSKLRINVIAKYQGKCAICGEEASRLQCHEVWDFDYKNRIQRLKGFVPLCIMCHMVKHMGVARVLSTKGFIDYNKLIEHFLKINQCSLKDFEEYRSTVFKKWRENSKINWKIDYKQYEELIKKN